MKGASCPIHKTEGREELKNESAPLEWQLLLLNGSASVLPTQEAKEKCVCVCPEGVSDREGGEGREEGEKKDRQRGGWGWEVGGERQREGGNTGESKRLAFFMVPEFHGDPLPLTPNKS